jgi:hypothetical protein
MIGLAGSHDAGRMRLFCAVGNLIRRASAEWAALLAPAKSD